MHGEAIAWLRAPELSRWERATGLALGADRREDDEVAPQSRLGPREALAAQLVDALAARPCVVSFSGGRDSSAVLHARNSASPVPRSAERAPLSMHR